MTSHWFKKDTFLIGALAGIVAKTIQTLIGFAVISYFPLYLNCVRIAAGLLFKPVQVMGDNIGVILTGIQIDFTVGIIVATVTVIFLQRWGFDYYLFKGAMVGLVSWALFYCTLSRFLSRVYPEGSILYAEISFFSHLVFGISLAWSAVWLSKRLSTTEEE